MSEASNWLDKGPIWRHPSTGEIAGPVERETDENGRAIITPTDRAMSWLLGVLGVVFVLASGAAFYKTGPNGSDFITTALETAAVIGLPVGFVTLIAIVFYRASTLKVRVVASIIVVVLLIISHTSLLLLLFALLVAAVAIYGAYYSPKEVNARMSANGFRKVEAKPKQEPYRPHVIPENYTGTWSVGSQSSEWVNGKVVGIYFWHSVQNYKADGTETKRFLQPLATEKYPYGWVFDASLPGYVPRQSDPYASPVAEGFMPSGDSEAYGKPSVIPEDMLRSMGAAHAQGREG